MAEEVGAAPAERCPGVLDNVVVVLYQPEDVVNVGSVVRVMTNFGLRHLRLVEPAAFDPYRIEGIAHRGGPVVQATRLYPSLEQALADCSLVLATTGRRRQVRRDPMTPREAAPMLLRAARANPGAPAAVLFGRERDGLPNSAIDQCHGIVTIPTDPANHSLNLSHAAAIVLYELWLAQLEGAPGAAAPAPASVETTPAISAGPAGSPADPGAPAPLARAVGEGRALAGGHEREAMFNALADLLEALFPRTAFQRRMSALARLRAILLRSAPGPDEVWLLTRLFRHLARVARAQGPSGEPPL